MPVREHRQIDLNGHDSGQDERSAARQQHGPAYRDDVGVGRRGERVHQATLQVWGRRINLPAASGDDEAANGGVLQ